MATTRYNLGFNPIWYIADMTGRPLGGGYMATFRSQNPNQQKFVYQDGTNQHPWPYVAIPHQDIQGILFNENGSQGPFYFEFDSNTPEELYFLAVYDSDGVLQWTINNYTATGGSGGSVVTTTNSLENLITNNVFLSNINASARPAPTTLILAPSNHNNLGENAQDIRFIKSLGSSADDKLTFVKFALGITPLNTDVTPVYYLNYICHNTFAGETAKYVLFPLTQGVKNYENQDITFTIWAEGISGTQTLSVYLYQYFGAGGAPSPSDPFATFLQTIDVASGWDKYTIHATVPSVVGKTLGDCGDDAVFILIQYPLGKECEINYTKPSLYLGMTAPTLESQGYDRINSIVNSPRTGDISMGLATFKFGGWVACNDGTIGSASSGATVTTSDNGALNTFPLFQLIWRNIHNVILAPIFTSAGAPSTYGTSAESDYALNKRLSLTKTLGRALAATGTASSGSAFGNWALGQTYGFEVVTLTEAQMPAHVHGAGSYAVTISATQAGLPGGPTNSLYQATVANALPAYAVTGISGLTGGSTAHDNIQPTVHYTVFLKL